MNIVAFSIHPVLFRFKIDSAYGKGRISYKLWFGGIILNVILKKEVGNP
jgi:hypothetical protein